MFNQQNHETSQSFLKDSVDAQTALDLT